MFSVVEHRDDPDLVLVRSRDLESLEYFTSKLARKPEILINAGTDYKYRLVTKKATWAKFVENEALAIDYNNFKNAAVPGAHPRSGFYHDVWGAGSDYQYRRHRVTFSDQLRLNLKKGKGR